MEYTFYNKKVYCKSSTKCCVKGPQGLKGDTGKTDIQYAIIYFEDASLNDISNQPFYDPSFDKQDTSNNGIINELIYDTSNNCLNLSSIENIDDYIVEIYAHLDIILDTTNAITLFMNLINDTDDNDKNDIDTRSVTKKNSKTHVTFGPVLYKAIKFNNDYKLHIDIISSDQNFKNNEYLSEIKLIIKLIKYQ